MARKLRGKGRPPGAPAPQSQGPRPQQAGGGGWGPLRDAVRRDIEQAASALAFAAALHERLEAQRRLFADFPRVMEQLRSGALERVSTALARLFEGKDQFDLTRFLRDLPLALAQLAVTEAARKGVPKEPSSPDQAAATPPAETTPAEGAPAESTPETSAPVAEASTSTPDTTSTDTSTSTPDPSSPSETISTSTSETTAPPTAAADAAPAATPTNGAPAQVEAPSPRLELRSRLLAASPQLSKAVVTYRRTVSTVRRAAAPRRAPGPWRSDHEVLDEAKRAVEFARQLFDAYAEAWADQPTQPGSGEAMSAETDRFLAWTQLARYMEVAAPRSQPPPPEKQLVAADKQPTTQGSPGAGATAAEGEPAHGA